MDTPQLVGKSIGLKKISAIVVATLVAFILTQNPAFRLVQCHVIISFIIIYVLEIKQSDWSIAISQPEI